MATNRERNRASIRVPMSYTERIRVREKAGGRSVGEILEELILQNKPGPGMVIPPVPEMIEPPDWKHYEITRDVWLKGPMLCDHGDRGPYMRMLIMRWLEDGDTGSEA